MTSAERLPQFEPISAVIRCLVLATLSVTVSAATADECKERLQLRTFPKFHLLAPRVEYKKAEGCVVEVFYSLSEKGKPEVYRVEYNHERCFFLQQEASETLLASTFSAGTHAESCSMQYIFEPGCCGS